MSSNAQNHWGKTPYMCTCGIPVNLEPHEIMDWQNRHAAHYAGIPHDIKQIGPPHQPDSIQGMVTSMFNAFQLQKDELNQQLQLMVQREIVKSLPKEVKK